MRGGHFVDHQSPGCWDGSHGSGIAQVCTQSGFETSIYDISSEARKKGLATIDKTLEKRVQKGKLSSDEKRSIMGRLKVVERLEEVKDADLAIEPFRKF
jgi:3-hydroxybutyryl-CoA dehydrogenase